MGKIIQYTLRSLAYTLSDPYWLFILAVLGFMLYRQNKKTTVMQQMILGEKLDSPLELTISQIVIGIVAGVFGSLLLSFIGIMFDVNSMIFLIFVVSLILMFLNPKYICFSYSGALLGVLSLTLAQISKVYSGYVISIVGYKINLANIDFLKIDIGSLMSLVAVMHYIEGLLVMFDGKTGAIPVFSNRNEKIIGGFAFKRYWALPIAIFMIVHNAGSSGSGEKLMSPNWWPLVKSSAYISISSAVLGLTSLYCMVGYNSVTFTKNKTEKTMISGGLIMIYSVLLFIVAQLARFGLIFQAFALIFAPVAHEIMLYIQKYQEVIGEPKYVSNGNGVMVLDVAPNTPAFEMGIKTGDLLIEINDKKIISEDDIFSVTNQAVNFIWFKIKRKNQGIKEVSYNKMNSTKRLGIVFVPTYIPKDSVVVKIEDNDKFRSVFDKIINKDDKNNIDDIISDNKDGNIDNTSNNNKNETKDNTSNNNKNENIDNTSNNKNENVDNTSKNNKNENIDNSNSSNQDINIDNSINQNTTDNSGNSSNENKTHNEENDSIDNKADNRDINNNDYTKK